jgi:hypothetical protein
MTTRRVAAAAVNQVVELHTPTGVIALPWPLPGSAAVRELQRHAIEWTRIVRNRSRWVRSEAGSEAQDLHAREFLRSLGVDDARLRQIADAGTVHVSIPFTDESTGWEARTLPWEFIISAGTRSFRSGPLVATRWLRRKQPAIVKDLHRVLFVESAPGRLALDWDFTDERRLVEKYTRAKDLKVLKSPTLETLRETVRQFRPGILHLAGFDTHQGLELAKDQRASDFVYDGYLLAAPGGVEPVEAGRLAQAIAPSGYAPSVIFCNFWNSAARVAPLLVAAGAGAAIGFQDGVDDTLAEVFVGNFYRGLAETKHLEAGFNAGWEALQSQRKPLRGTGIVLWRGGAVEQAPARAPIPSHTKPAGASDALVPSAVSAREVSQLIAVDVEPEPLFSYGLLHNDRDLFRRFVILSFSDAPLRGLDVFVELHTNEGTYPWRQSFVLDSPVLDLQRKVRIALTSNLARTVDEVLRTSLYVKLTWGTHEVFSQTFAVTLAPVDQWADTDADRIFLPSYVFPRDAAVRSVIRNAEHFVTALRDDPTAGFDGYQALDPEAADPAANVDKQVQALWYSVVYKVPASYINPPPTYAVASQRIRTPSEVVAGGYGTCIDLALMMASCLEAVEIYPVVFLLNDHAFPGYWRTDKARDSFLRRAAQSSATPGAAADDGQTNLSAVRVKPSAPWSFDATTLSEIKRAIDANRLVPLESVGLTGRWSLADAISQGRDYFSDENAGRFLAMFDVLTAREQGVTPLPLGTRLG